MHGHTISQEIEKCYLSLKKKNNNNNNNNKSAI